MTELHNGRKRIHQPGKLPNKTTTKYFYVHSWDILFLKNYLFNLHEKLSDQDLWNVRGMSSWDKFKLKILDKIL